MDRPTLIILFLVILFLFFRWRGQGQKPQGAICPDCGGGGRYIRFDNPDDPQHSTWHSTPCETCGGDGRI